MVGGGGCVWGGGGGKGGGLRSYLEGVLAADVVVRFDRGNDIARHGNTAQDRLLSTVCLTHTHNTHTHRYYHHKILTKHQIYIYELQ